MQPLEAVLSYENENVVHRFAEEHALSVSDANEIFRETKRWLWLCASRKLAVDRGEAEFIRIPLFNEAFAIDLMWHTFLLYTQDYADFCERHFGFFVHHHPRDRKERLAWQERIKNDPEGAQREREADLRKVYSHLYDELGPEVLKLWCEEFPARFRFKSVRAE